MNNRINTLRAITASMGVLCFATAANAQFFTANKGDLLLGFRKAPGSGTWELVVNIGNVTNFINVPAGTSINISTFTPAQLSAAFSSYGSLQWSVSSAFAGSSAWAGFPASTIWSTVARSSTNVQSQVPLRDSDGAQQQAKPRIYGVGLGANSISSGLGTTNDNNNSQLVREPATDTSALTVYIGDPSDSSQGNFQGYWYNVESITPFSFTTAQRSDLYQSCPDGTTDPTTTLTTGNAYYIGYFQFNANGTMSFTRATAVPPAPTLTFERAGNVSTISFPTTSGATYTLYYTNSAAISRPISSWAASSTNVIGDGLTRSFTDTTANADRIYSVGAH